MEVILAAPRGFCAGVVRAVDIVELCIQRFGSPIYVRHEIVHNAHVVETLQKIGAIFVDDVADVPFGQTIVFAAHGVAPSVRDEAIIRGLRVVDATCPLVTKVHLEALKYSSNGYTIILVGHRGHDEVVGTMGEAPEQTILVETAEEVAEVNVKDPDRVVALTQTTLSVEDTSNVIDALKERFPKLVTRNDICYATTNRQKAVKAMSSDVDIVLVIGSDNSSNCNRLREAAEDAGLPAYLINGPGQIDYSWFNDLKRIGVTAGASTPESLVESVIEALGPLDVRTVEVAEENVSFALPKIIRSQ
jgi:4-hydroxy-3-methylbut-2-enyl diphosphate reductase